MLCGIKRSKLEKMERNWKTMAFKEIIGQYAKLMKSHL